MTDHEIFWDVVTDLSKELEPEFNLDLSEATNSAKKRMESFDQTKLDRMSIPLEVINTATQVINTLVVAIALIFEIKKHPGKNSDDEKHKTIIKLSEQDLKEWKDEIIAWLDDHDEAERKDKLKVIKKAEKILKRKYLNKE